MLQTVREAGPGVLVPAAWLVVGAAHLDRVTEQSILIAHLVMAGFLLFFLLTGYREMTNRVLQGWGLIMVAGLGITLAGIAGFLVPAYEQWLWGVSLVGWMLLPAIGLVFTGSLMPAAAAPYIAGAALSLLGAMAYFMSVLAGGGEASLYLAVAGIALVGVGQTIGIGDAVLNR